MELIAHGATAASVMEHTGFRSIPPSIQKYLFCSPAMDFKFRCLPSAGGLYDQLYRDVAEFSIIESRLRDIQGRK